MYFLNYQLWKERENLAKCYCKPPCSAQYFCDPHCLSQESQTILKSLKWVDTKIWEFTKKTRTKESCSNLTALRPVRSVSFPFTNPPMIPPTITIEPKTEYCTVGKTGLIKLNDLKHFQISR